MSTTIRPELSEKNEYWIERHRYYELKHFCLQYPVWKKERAALGLLKSSGIIEAAGGAGNISDPVKNTAEARSFYTDRMRLVEDNAIFASGVLSDYLLKAVTTGASYDYLKAKLNIPCGKDTYYKVYRRFFWLLDKARK